MLVASSAHRRLDALDIMDPATVVCPMGCARVSMPDEMATSLSNVVDFKGSTAPLDASVKGSTRSIPRTTLWPWRWTKRGRRHRQTSMRVAAEDLPRSAAHPFYMRPNQILDKGDFKAPTGSRSSGTRAMTWSATPALTTACLQPVVKDRRRTEAAEAPRRQGATTENTGQYLRKKQRSRRGCHRRPNAVGLSPRAARGSTNE